MTTFLRAELYQGPPLQLDFSGTAPRIVTGTATPIKQKPREVAVARLPVPYGGPKTCTQCGTTRTPQWREGPCGPKTLCNACGVKLVRKNRGTAEAKRRAAGEKAASAAAAAQLFMDRNSPSPEPWSTGGDSCADETPLAADLAASSPCLQSSPRSHEPSPLGPQQQLSRRPVRRAAAKAASRTAEYATTGDWPKDEGVVPALGDAHSDASVENSDSAEEVAWAPRQSTEEHATCAVAALGLPASMRQETSAAINLMAMSFKGGREQGARPVTPSSPAAAAPLAVPQTDASVPHQDPQATPRSAPRLQHLRKHAQLSAQEQATADFLRHNSPARFSQYEALQLEADVSWRAADSAQLSVNAIAKFLAQRQAASMRACDAARAATQLLHTFLEGADTDLGVTRGTKRQRV